MAKGATAFPQAIALASTWDPALVERVFTATALEARARGANWVLTPVLDIAREPRWGRTEETLGEDPFLVSRLGVAAIRGLQGRGPGIATDHVLATAKHFAAHGQPEGGTNAAPANYSERILREQLLPSVRGRRARGRGRQRDGLLQRDRRHPVARQPLAARRSAARRVGLPGARLLGRRRDRRSRRRATTSRPTSPTPRARRSRPGSTSSWTAPFGSVAADVRGGRIDDSAHRRGGRARAARQAGARPLRRPLRRPGARRARHELPRAPRARARGGAQGDRAAEERAPAGAGAAAPARSRRSSGRSP